MDGRQRVRRQLGAGGADRPPLIVFATEFAARLEQVEPRLLWEDANVLTRTLVGLETLFGLDAVVVDVPAVVVGGGELEAIGDGLARLRVLLGDRTALVLALPGPLTVGARGSLEEAGGEILDVAKRLGPEHADCVAVVEHVPISDAEALDDALTPLWNTARYYTAASLLVAAEGGAELAESGADAVAVWAGASPAELAEAGARHVGCPIDPVAPAAPVLPELPAGGFYTLRGELPADTDIDWLHQLIAAVGS